MKLNDILIVSDIDNTLTDSKRQIPLKNREAISAFIEAGGMFTVGSGRSVSLFSQAAADIPLNAPCVLYNGAVLYDWEKKEVLDITSFSDEEYEKALKAIGALDPELFLCIERTDDTYLPAHIRDRLTACDSPVLKRFPFTAEMPSLPLDEIRRPWIKVIAIGDEKKVAEFQAGCAALGLNGQASLPFLYEFQAAGVSKGSAARKLAEKLGRKVLVSIGDAPNDLPMLEEADLAFIPENAQDSVKNRGFRVCASSEEGAVADAIRILTELCRE